MPGCGHDRRDAMRGSFGGNPNNPALPKTFTAAAVHLCVKDREQNSRYRDGAPAHPGCCGQGVTLGTGTAPEN